MKVSDKKETSDGKITTPLEKAVVHLLKIGSTDKKELELMADQFITEKGACKRLGINYPDYALRKFKDDVYTVVGKNSATKIKINIRKDFYEELLGATNFYSAFTRVGFVWGIEFFVVPEMKNNYHIEEIL